MLLQFIVDLCAGITQDQVLVLSLVLTARVFYQLVVFPFFVSALRHIPGPYIHRISAIPSLYAQQRFRWIGTIHKLHERYGNVVILSPNSVSFNGDPKYINDLYVKNMPKGDYYANFKFHGEVNMFCELDNDKHLAYKKVVLGNYSKSAVFNPKNTTRRILADRVRELVNQVYLTSVSGKISEFTNPKFWLDKSQKNSTIECRSSSETSKSKSGIHSHGNGIDVHSLFASLAMDVVSGFELGLENRTRLLENTERRSIINSHRVVTAMVFWTTRAPKLWNRAAGSVVRNACAEIEKWQLLLYKRAEEKAGKEISDRNPSTLEAFQSHGLNIKKIYSNVSDNLIAGHDTTATQLTYMCYELSRPVNHGVQKQLRSELRSAFGKPSETTSSPSSVIEDLEKVDKLPFLEALMQENLRVHAPTPGPEYRVTNKDYVVNLGDHKVCIPPNTEVSCQPYSMHRVETVFPDPERWHPQRWLQSNTESEEQFRERLREMQRYMMPFGKGIRMCLGMNLALIEIKLALANLYWRYESTICPEWCEVVSAEKSGVIRLGDQHSNLPNDESLMSMEDSYVSHPSHDECWLNWSEA